MERINTLYYKNYYTNITRSEADDILYGKLEGIPDLVTFVGESEEDIGREFRSAVDDYLAFCAEVGKAPEVCSAA